MNGVLSRLLLAALVLVAAIPDSWAQFGQNKISYHDHEWQVYEAPHFNVYYYPSVEPFLEEIVSDAESAYLSISQQLDHELRFRVPLVIYKTHGEFLQTNITLSSLPEAVGAFAEPVQYRMVLPIDEPPDKLYKLIAHELTHIFQYSMFYDGYLGRALRSNPPTWLMEGMASYIANDEDNLDRMAIRDAVANNVLPPIQALGVLSFLTYRYGHAVFDYIEQEHGKEGLRSFLFEFKKVLLTNNIGKAIKEAFGYDIDEFNRRFNRYLRNKYFPVLLEKKSPDEYGTEIRFKRSQFNFSPTLSPSGELVAALAAPKMDIDLVVLSAEDGSEVKNLTKGWTNKYTYLATEAPAGRRDISWSPTSDRIAVFARREDQWPLLIFDALSGKIVEDIVFGDIYECAGPIYSPDGKRVAFEGNRNGVVDIFEIDLETREIRNLTQDDFFDANPWYSDDARTLLYNRRIGSYWKVFSVDLSDPSKKTQLTFGPSSDLQPSYSRDGKTIYFASDRGEYGVFNIHALDLETGDLSQYTDVVGGCFVPVEMAERDGERNMVFGAYFNGTFRLYRMPLLAPELKVAAGDRLEIAGESEPFAPDLQLSVDNDKKAKYKPKWDIDLPDIGVGVADDGTFLANAALQFTDLLGNQRIFVSAASVADYGSYNLTYYNLKRRYNWGATAYDYRDYYVSYTTGQRIRRQNQQTGAAFLLQYPFTRNYRFETSAGLIDSSTNQAYADSNAPGGVGFVQYSNRFAMVSAAFVGDTTRWQGYRPFQGKRFRIAATYGHRLSGTFQGNLTEARFDYRAYKQLTRRSTLAWRLFTVYNFGDYEPSYAFGGLNELRGYEFRDFFGSKIAGTNLELRFPLVDQLRFPGFPWPQIRGFLFVDVGAAWFDDFWYDPELQEVSGYGTADEVRFRHAGVRFDPATGVVPFKFWDSDNNRLRDGRASYGAGFQFIFLGGLQFNWVWAYRAPYTQFLIDLDDPSGGLIEEEVSGRGVRSEFYITYDF